MNSKTTVKMKLPWYIKLLGMEKEITFVPRSEVAEMNRALDPELQKAIERAEMDCPVARTVL